MQVRILLVTILILVSLPLELHAQKQMQSLVKEMEYRNIGPANQGGRITDIEARPNDFAHVFIAVASGGVWKSENAGTSWAPIFDDYETASIGDIALDPNNEDIIWVGTGESNNRNSVSWGNGMYKSSDGGASFQNKGLESTHQIARVLVHPEDSDDVCVCALGHLWGYSGERGLFQSKNGGDKWKKLGNGLPTDGKTGCIDLVRDSKNPNILYSAFYHRLRKPWNFESGGGEGGIFKSIDNGKSWKKLSQGLPSSPTGRVGLAIYDKDPRILMAIIEAKKTDDLSKPGSGIYRSEDGGETWKYLNTYNNRPFYYSQIRINPTDDQKIYVLTTRFMVSENGGKSFENGSKDQEIHGDFHAMWIDPKDPDRYYIGADKGLSMTYDHGKNFKLIDNLPIAQFYRINYDMRDPFYVYGGLQDNGSYATASFSRDARGILSDSNWKMHWGDGQDAASNPNDWTDMYTSMENGSYFKYNPKTRALKRISPSALNTINHWEYFDPNETDKASETRFNWSAPLQMSTHNPHHIFVGGNHLYKSLDQGSTWEIISPDLSTNDTQKRIQGRSGGVTPDNTGAETHCAITGIAVSEIDEDLIWICTDDGNVQVSKDGGLSWANTRSKMKNLPDEIWASKIEASKFEKGRAYVTFDGHRSDNFKTYIYKTENYGKSWERIVNGFTKGETVRVIREDHINENLLFAGTETGVWFTIDQGKYWQRLKLNMPTVSVYDLKIHPREHSLIVGSHGRSLWILDDITPLQQLTKEVLTSGTHLFDQKQTTLWNNISRGGQRGHFWYAGDNPKSIMNTSTIPRAAFKNMAKITYYVGEAMQDSLILEVKDLSGKYSYQRKVAPSEGIHEVYWDRVFDSPTFSDDELSELDDVLKSIVNANNHRRIKAAYAKFKEASSSTEIRNIVEPLTRGYLSYNIDQKFLVPRANEGTYKLTLSSQTSRSIVSENILVVRTDPMNRE